MMFSGDETTDVGTDSGTPVSDDSICATSRFTGRVRWVEIDLGEDAQDADHLITPEERLQHRDGAPIGVARGLCPERVSRRRRAFRGQGARRS